MPVEFVAPRFRIEAFLTGRIGPTSLKNPLLPKPLLHGLVAVTPIREQSTGNGKNIPSLATAVIVFGVIFQVTQVRDQLLEKRPNSVPILR